MRFVILSVLSVGFALLLASKVCRKSKEGLFIWKAFLAFAANPYHGDDSISK